VPVSVGERVVELRVPMAATPAAVWQAVMDPAVQPRWLGGFRFDTDWTVGGRFALRGTLQGRPYEETGRLLVLVPGRELAFSHWSRLWRVPDVPANQAILTLSIAAAPAARRGPPPPRPDGAVVALHHELPKVVALAQHSRFFWSVALDQLRRAVEDGAQEASV
jgi:uncharacterized protein YndB with AHSA1/START domain